MTGFNLSEWALRHRALVIFAMILSIAAGLSAYLALGRAEDPTFTVKTMVIRVAWPGASAREVETQITDEIERALQETPNFDYVTSYSRAGEATLFVWLRDNTPPSEVPDSWYQVRKRVGDIRSILPSGVVGPYFNDDFGDTFGSIYAFRSDGFDDAEMKRVLLAARQRLLRIPDVSKVELWGVQEQRFFVEFETGRLAALGLTPQAIFDSLARQNAVVPAGTIEGPSARIRLDVSGAVDSVESIRATPVEANGRQFRLGDIATITRGFNDPPVFSMWWNGERVTALAVSMVKGGDILGLGENLATEMAAIQGALPAGIAIEQVSDQPYVVEHSVSEFELHFLLAVGIVLGVSFLSLGWRAGLVVALSVPLVLAITFVIMDLGGLDLHRISLGALIIALGLLVDDAIIAVEMILVKLEEGWDRFRAASYAWTSTAFPMLTGTLITAAGFVPVGFARSSSGEYTTAIFWVVGISLVVSWIVAVLFTPYLGYKLLPSKGGGHGTHGYDGKLYQRFRSAVDWCVTRRKLTLALTVGAFVASLAAFPLVPQQFFPSSSREEILIDLELPEGSSYAATLAEAQRLERLVRADTRTESIVTYVGGGGPRFYLALNPELPNLAYAQFIAKPKDEEDSAALARDLDARLKVAMPHVRVRVSRLENGPPVGYPVQFRVMGPDPDTVRGYAAEVRDLMRADQRMRDVNLQWFERTKALRLVVDQDRARALGLTPQDVAQTLQTLLSGYTVTQVREGSELIDVVARAVSDERAMADRIGELSIRVAAGGAVPLDQVAKIEPVLEDGVIWRRNRDATLVVRGDVTEGVQGPDVSGALDAELDSIRERLPTGYRIEMGGAVEEAAKGSASIFKLFPLMLALWLTLLMVQLQSFSRMTMVFLTAPLGLIGVVFGLLLFQTPFGFVAQLGVIALAGMIMRNSVILVDQIDRDIATGVPAWTAIVEATVRRARPVVLTALAAILAMIPLTWSTFWGPMAIAIMGGLAIATVLTLFFVPALYALWFRVRRGGSSPNDPPAASSDPVTA